MHFNIFSLIITFLSLLPKSNTLPHHFPPLLNTPRAANNLHAPPQQPPPIEFFEVTHPIRHPPTTTPCTHPILNHDFGYTYGREPVRATYTPPSHCKTSESNTIILEWSATCQGRQFDRIFGVWLSGVELLRSCTAEPTRGGIFWKVKKDITRYKSLLMTRNQTLQIYLGNLIDKTYTGVYHVNITIYFYPHVSNDQNHLYPGKNDGFDNHAVINSHVKYDQTESNPGKKGGDVDFFYDPSVINPHVTYDQIDRNPGKKGGYLDFNQNPVKKNPSDNILDGSSGLDRIWADLILPISRNSPLKDGLWFEIQNSTDVESKEIVIPRNVYKAVLEVYVSYHENDEFWYSNAPDEYIIANNLTGKLQGNGVFREVLVSLDGDLVGSICPFTVIYTGGINPLLWRPITAIGSFDLPTYDIEITPFLGRLLDGKSHSFGFSVTNALNVWYVDANLHLWLDERLSVTKGSLVKHNVEPVKLMSKSGFKGFDGQFFTGASRSIVSTGWVESSYGNLTTTSIQSFEFENCMILGKDGNLQIVNQTIEYNTSVSVNASRLYMIEIQRKFPLFLYTDEFDLGNSSYTYQSNVTLGFNVEKIEVVGTEISLSSLRNFQKGGGNMVVKNNLVQGGLGSTHQIYEYNENNGGNCYFRNVSSYNYTILYDHERKTCKSEPRDCVSESDNLGILLRQ